MKPGKIRILDTVWTYEYVKNLRTEDGRRLFGQTNSWDRHIRLDSGQHPGVMRLTKLHEGIHACLGVSGASTMDPDIEEQFATDIEVPLLSLFDNNAGWLK